MTRRVRWLVRSWATGRILVGLNFVKILPVRLSHPEVETYAVVILAPERATRSQDWADRQLQTVEGLLPDRAATGSYAAGQKPGYLSMLSPGPKQAAGRSADH